MARPKGSRNKTKADASSASRQEGQKMEPIETLKTVDNTKTDNMIESVDMTAVTPDQQAIRKRVEAESAEWEPITEESMNDFSLMINPLDLKDNFPEAWKEQVEKRYAFRWCERRDKRIDELTRSGHPITRWKLCTRTTTPFLAKYVDAIWGCVTRLDQVLLHRPWDRHMIEKRAKQGMAEARANAGKPENVASRRAGEGVEVYSGPEHKIGQNDVVQWEDTGSSGIHDLVAES